MTEKTITCWPGGISTLSGGSRDEIKLSRPWQPDLPINPASCPFESEALERDKRKVFHETNDGGGWKVLDNIATPHDHPHWLIIPSRCWEAQELHELGGVDRLSVAFRMAKSLMADLPYPEQMLEINKGSLGGMNLGHPHMHLFRPEEKRAGRADAVTTGLINQTATSGLTVFQDGPLIVTVGGHSAGQIWILPRGDYRWDPNLISELPALAVRVARLLTEAFRSSQGKPPDFTVGLVFEQGCYKFGGFVPRLNNWAASEYFALLGYGTADLPWTHERTADHLRSVLARTPK